MGVIPLQFLEGENAEKLGITGKELFSIEIPQDLKPGQNLTVKVSEGNGVGGGGGGTSSIAPAPPPQCPLFRGFIVVVVGA